MDKAQILGPEANLLQLVYYFIRNPKERGRHGETITGRTRCVTVHMLVSFESLKIDIITFQVLGTVNHGVGAN